MARRRTEAAEEPRKTYTVAYPHGLNLRAEPSKRARVIRVIPNGNAVTVLDITAPEGWVAVDGGYVMREFLE